MTTIIAFLVVLTVLVFVHEFGHFWVARRCGVQVDIFSVGFGPELWGRTDTKGTRWRLSAIPLGGYVKFHGDADAASRPDKAAQSMSPQELERSFFHKSLGQRAAIVVAGPAANYLFAMVLLAGLFATYGNPVLPYSVVGEVSPDSPAEAAGLTPGDEILSVDGQAVSRFSDLRAAVRTSQGDPLTLTISRDGQERTLTLTPAMNSYGEGEDQVTIPQIGVLPDIGPMPVGQAIAAGVTEPFALSWMALSSIAEMIVGDRSTEELGGPLRIAQISGEVAQIGVLATLWWMAALSINLGLINLFPIPMLDGGHLMFYAIEALKGRPLGDKAQEIGFRIGLGLILALLVFATINDVLYSM